MMGRPEAVKAPKAAREWLAAFKHKARLQSDRLAVQRWPDRAKEASALARVRRGSV
jgi:hypothetical protein